MTELRGPKNRWRRIVEREPLKIWAASFAAVALTVQALAYSSTSWFYEAFHVSPEEVGFSYADILGRKALEIALVSMFGLLLLVILSSMLAFVTAILATGWAQALRGRLENQDPIQAKASWRSFVLLFGALIGWLVSIVLLRLSSSWMVGAFAILWLLLAIAIDYHVVTRRGTWQSSAAYRLIAQHHSYSIARMTGWLLIIAIVAGVSHSLGNGLVAIAFVVPVDIMLPRAKDFEEAVEPKAFRFMRTYFTRWLLGIVAITLLALSLGIVIFGAASLSLTSLGPMARNVYQGRGIEWSPYHFNPLLIAEPRAEEVRVRWVASDPPNEFQANAGQAFKDRPLILFGSANGTSVFFDPSTKNILRLPSGSLVIVSARPIQAKDVS